MLFYDKVEPLDSVRHADWRVSEDANWSFAAGTNAVPLLVQEFAAAHRDYAIAFIENQESGCMPVAILGLQDARNHYVNEEGRWVQGTYVPAYVRRFPFAPVVSDNGRLAVFVETSSGIVGPGGNGQALFENGQPSPKLQEILKLLEGYHDDALTTQAFCAKLKELNLLDSVSAEVRTGEQEHHRLDGFLVVNEQRLAALDDQTALDLFRAGFLGPIHAHLLSMGNLLRLAA